MLISPEYRDLNHQLHQTRPDYGTTVKKYVEQIDHMAQSVGAVSVLDYGCGKGLLAEALPHLLIAEYDPAIAGKDAPPDQADLVVCVDVLEHIEPECLDAVLDDLHRLTRKAIFLTVATRPAVKFLADGRNAHLIVEPFDWWRPRLEARFKARLCHTSEGEFALFATPRPKIDRTAA